LEVKTLIKRKNRSEFLGPLVKIIKQNKAQLKIIASGEFLLLGNRSIEKLKKRIFGEQKTEKPFYSKRVRKKLQNAIFMVLRKFRRKIFGFISEIFFVI